MSSVSIVTQAHATAESPAGLAFQGISKRWSGAPAAVLDRVDLVVEPGTVVCVSGANGAGKTTLLRIAAGVVAPDEGSVRLGHIDATAHRTEYQRHIGFLSTSP